MRKSKVSLTLDADAIAELAALTQAPSLSAAVTSAVADKVERLRQRKAIDEWVRSWEAEHGPITDAALEAWQETWRRLDA